MASNPFLMMEEDVPASEGHNPFLSGDFNIEEVAVDNPFSGSNPFSDFGTDATESTGMDILGTIPMDTTETSSPFTTEVTTAKAQMSNIFDMDDTDNMPFFQQPISHTQVVPIAMKPRELELNQNDNAYVSDEELQTKPSRPLPPRPVAPETKDLILSVTGQMDFTSSHLLDRIPPTRSPSPISMRDLHSPSPTPDFGLGDFEVSSDNKENADLFTMDDIDDKQNVEPEIINEEKPFSGNVLFETNQNKPERPLPPAKAPPPARPPARPLPPRPAPPPVTELNNDINLFEAPAPPPPIKPTKEAILSLYSTPKKQEEEKQIDFLSDDIIESTEAAADKDSSFSQQSSNETVKEVTAVPAEAEATFEASPDFDLSNNDKDLSNENAFELPEEDEDDHAYVTEIIEAGESIKPIVTESFVDLSNPFSNVESFAPSTCVTVTNVTVTAPVPSEDILTSNASQSGDFFSTTITTHPSDIIAQSDSGNVSGDDPFARTPKDADLFDEFSMKFESTGSKTAGVFDAFGGASDSAWGDKGAAAFGGNEPSEGFGTDSTFDAFLNIAEPPPVPSGTPAPFGKDDSQESDYEGFNVFIKPKENGAQRSFFSSEGDATVPTLAPPPKQMQAPAAADSEARFNPFDKSANFAEAMFSAEPQIQQPSTDGEKHSGSETPPTPLFDDDVSQPLEDFPRMNYGGPGWEMQLRQPNKKKITGQRFWKKIFVKITYQGDNPVVQLYNSGTDKEPFQELPLQACYSVSDIGAQQYDQFGKIFTIKLQYVFYKERPGVRPGQVTKAERLTNKISQFAAYAIQGDYQGVKEFGSDLKKLGLPVEHAPQISQLFKIGSVTFEDVKQFSFCIEECLFHISAHRDRALTYKMEEVQITAVDELYVEQDAEGCILKQIARVRLFFLGFLSGMPDIELGVNDMRRQGKEVVGRHDIIPVVTEEWIRLEEVEFHACVQPEDFHNTKIIKFKPPDACYIELMRFRVRPPKNRELPLQLKAVMCVTGNKVELRADCLVPGFASRKLGQVPCEDVMIRFPIPECWIYLFRVEKHFRYGSVKSAHRRTGKIKGIERFLGAMETLQESLIEVTSGQAKYEHQHRSIVWRIPRLPKEGQGAYTTHNLVCRMALTSYDQIPDQLSEWCYVEFTMPATQVSHMTVRSVSLQNHDSDEPPEKYVRYLARHEYKVGIEHTKGSGPTNAYTAATNVTSARPAPAPIAEAPAPTVAPPSSDSDSD